VQAGSSDPALHDAEAGKNACSADPAYEIAIGLIAFCQGVI
jgi:hypothetical protein